jgi:hypothetical protein
LLLKLVLLLHWLVARRWAIIRSMPISSLQLTSLTWTLKLPKLQAFSAFVTWCPQLPTHMWHTVDVTQIRCMITKDLMHKLNYAVCCYWLLTNLAVSKEH